MKQPRVLSEKIILDTILNMIPHKLPEDVIRGIGDDCAVTVYDETNYQLLKTDSIVEGIHYFSDTPLEIVGRKAVARAISDIAAMGGKPYYALITVNFSPSWQLEDWKNLYSGIIHITHQYGISIIGGETTKSGGIASLSITLTGIVKKKHLKLRSTASAGNLLFVTGYLGGSLKNNHHLFFQPRLQEGIWLGSEKSVTAMMDISDGLGSDAQKLADASNLSFEIDKMSIPCNSDCSVEQSITDGEDYELLIAVEADKADLLLKKWQKDFKLLPLTCIGQLRDKIDCHQSLAKGYDHFTPFD